jgi:hypothetical protein
MCLLRGRAIGEQATGAKASRDQFARKCAGLPDAPVPAAHAAAAACDITLADTM